MRILGLLNLHCSKTDNDGNNNSKVNETFLTVENGRVYVFGPDSMINGSDWNINAEIHR
jgi:hypothetical protein